MADEFSERYGDLLTGSYDCVDRVVLNAYFSLGHNPGGFRVWWRRWHGGSDQSLDNTHLMRMAGRFARRVRAYGAAHEVPVLGCAREQRKHRIAEDYLREHDVGPGVFLILVARAPATVWDVKRSAGGVLVNLAKKQAFVNHYSFHLMDPDWGHVTIKMSGHPPFPAQVILNGHEYVACRAQAGGIGFTKEGNCFTAVPDPKALAQVADTLSQPGTVGRLRQVIDRWIYSLLCFGLDLDEQQRGGFRYAYSVYQVEYSRNLLFADGARMDRAFNAVVDRTRSPLDVPRVRTLFGLKARPHRRAGADLSPREAAVIETPRWGPDPVQGPLRAVDPEGLHQRRARAALRGDHPQHPGAEMRADAGQVPRDRQPPRGHDRSVLHRPGLRGCRLPAQRHPGPAAGALPDRADPGRGGST
jgi:hypothetical protein